MRRSEFEKRWIELPRERKGYKLLRRDRKSFFKPSTMKGCYLSWVDRIPKPRKRIVYPSLKIVRGSFCRCRQSRCVGLHYFLTRRQLRKFFRYEIRQFLFHKLVIVRRVIVPGNARVVVGKNRHTDLVGKCRASALIVE